MIPVQSSRLQSIGWQPEAEGSTNGLLWVVFSDGTSGVYEDVPREIFEQFRDSPSKGQFLARYIIPQYNFMRAALPQ